MCPPAGQVPILPQCSTVMGRVLYHNSSSIIQTPSDMEHLGFHHCHAVGQSAGSPNLTDYSDLLTESAMCLGQLLVIESAVGHRVEGGPLAAGCSPHPTME